MDRNQFLGLILMLVLITVYFQFFAPEPPAPEEIDNIVESTEPITPISEDTVTTTTMETVLSDSAQVKLNEMKFGLFSPLASGQNKQLTIENENIEVTFNSKGGSISKVVLKDYKRYDGEPLTIFNGGQSINVYFEHLSRQINLSDLYFDSQTRNINDTTVVNFSFNVNGAGLVLTYKVPKAGYLIGYEIESKGFHKQIEAKNLNLFWSAKLARLETDLKDARNRTSVMYQTTNGDSDNLSRTSTSHEEETLQEPVKWVSFNQKFFTSSIIAENAFNSAFVTLDPSSDSSFVKNASMQLEIPYTDLAAGKAKFSLFYGPNDYHVLKTVTDGFSANLELGWFLLPWINKFLVIPIFNFLENYIPNYGIVIIVMVLLIRLLLSPLTYRSHISMAKMRVLKPELDAIKERVGEDMQKQQTEQMDLYRKAGINPLSGCIPMLLQFPILVSLFYFIPAAIELRMVPFLWADDLSTYDSILNLPFNIPWYGDHVSLFTLLMAISTLLYSIANAQVTTVQGPMKTLQYIMPVMLLFFFNSYPSGLSYYYFISNLVSFGQIALFRKFIDEDKIKQIMEENKKKNANKKKSKFQQRLEDAMKANVEAQKREGPKKKTKKK
jgi:YidC/Oxa1 family membrane protein insertase